MIFSHIIECFANEEFVKNYFNGNMPDKVNANTIADIMIKCGIYK